jgi:hypothetical protein
LSNQQSIKLLNDAQAAGYYVGLYYFALDSIEINFERVQRRVEKGGHGTPEANIRRRYEGSLKLSEALGCADEALLIDNSGIEPREIFRVGAGVIVGSAVDRRNPLHRLFEGRVVEACDLLRVGEAYRSRTSVVGIRCRERRASCAVSPLPEA